MPRLRKGSTIGNYRIEEQIGRGGMGVVYSATHLGLDRKVALKLIAEDLSEDEGFRERFRREPRIAASIDHENVVPVFDAGEAGDHLYVAMRLIEGSDLGTILKKEGELDPRRAASIVAQVGEALDAAHARGLVHRDVKPANVLIEKRNGHEHAYLTDFGITKAGGGSIGLTRTGDWVGTADYVAPEQIQGEKLDERTDVYALGAVLYHSLAGEAPYAHDSEVAKIYAHLSKPIPPISEKRRGVSPELEATIRRAMAKKPKDRYPSAGEFGRESLAIAQGKGKLSRATQKFVGAEPEAVPPPEPVGETAISSPTVEPAKTAAPKPKRRMGRRARRSAPPEAPPSAKPERAKPEPVAVAETKLGKPKAKAKPRKPKDAAAKPKPPRTAPRRPNRNTLIGIAAAGIVLLGVAGFALGSSGSGGSSDKPARSGPAPSSSSSSVGVASSSADPAYAASLNAAIRGVNVASRSKLKAAQGADTALAEAGPLGDLSATYRRAAASLGKTAHGPELKAANVAIIAALGGLGDGYDKMASAASSGDESGYNSGKAAVRQGERKLQRALSRLSAFGYQVSN
jgi:serine/threonine protein kinase